MFQGTLRKFLEKHTKEAEEASLHAKGAAQVCSILNTLYPPSQQHHSLQTHTMSYITMLDWFSFDQRLVLVGEKLAWTSPHVLLNVWREA
jgi:hypothetical protein